MRMLKKIMKTAGIVLLALIVLLIAGLKLLAVLPAVSKNYRTKIETGGDIETKYLQDGPYDVSYYEEEALQVFEKYEIWYPSEMLEDDQVYPVIVVCNGTGMKASKSKYQYEYYASWGFIVVATEETYSWNGVGAEMSVRHLERLNENQMTGDTKNIFYRKIDFENVGIIGHSQGGVGVISAVTGTDHKDIYKAAVSLSPTCKETSEGLEWYYDASKVQIPVMLVSGEGGGDDWVVTGEGLADIYSDISSDKVMMRRKGTAHGETQTSEDGYVMAWFRYWLQDDKEAGMFFTGSDPELLHNSMYQDVMIQIISETDN